MASNNKVVFVQKKIVSTIDAFMEINKCFPGSCDAIVKKLKDENPIIASCIKIKDFNIDVLAINDIEKLVSIYIDGNPLFSIPISSEHEDWKPSNKHKNWKFYRVYDVKFIKLYDDNSSLEIIPTAKTQHKSLATLTHSNSTDKMKLIFDKLEEKLY